MSIEVYKYRNHASSFLESVSGFVEHEATIYLKSKDGDKTIIDSVSHIKNAYSSITDWVPNDVSDPFNQYFYDETVVHPQLVCFNLDEISFVTDRRADTTPYNVNVITYTPNKAAIKQITNKVNIEPINYETNPILRKEIVRSRDSINQLYHNSRIPLYSKEHSDMDHNFLISGKVTQLLDNTFTVERDYNTPTPGVENDNPKTPYIRFITIKHKEIDGVKRYLFDAPIRAAIIFPNEYTGKAFHIEEGMIVSTDIGLFRIIDINNSLFTDPVEHFLPGFPDYKGATKKDTCRYVNLVRYLPYIKDISTVNQSEAMLRWMNPERIGNELYRKEILTKVIDSSDSNFDMLKDVAKPGMTLAMGEHYADVSGYNDPVACLIVDRKKWKEYAYASHREYSANAMHDPLVTSIGKGFWFQNNITSLEGPTYIDAERISILDKKEKRTCYCAYPNRNIGVSAGKHYNSCFYAQAKAIDEAYGLCVIRNEYPEDTTLPPVLTIGDLNVRPYLNMVHDYILIPVTHVGTGKQSHYPIFIKYRPYYPIGETYRVEVSFIYNHPNSSAETTRLKTTTGTCEYNSLDDSYDTIWDLMYTQGNWVHKQKPEQQYFKIIAKKEYIVDLNYDSAPMYEYMHKHTTVFQDGIFLWRHIMKTLMWMWYIVPHHHIKHLRSIQDELKVTMPGYGLIHDASVFGIVYPDRRYKIPDNHLESGVLDYAPIEVVGIEGYNGTNIDGRKVDNNDKDFHVPMVRELGIPVKGSTVVLNMNFIKTWKKNDDGQVELEMSYDGNNPVYIPGEYGTYIDEKLTIHSTNKSMYCGFMLRDIIAAREYKQILGYRQGYIVTRKLDLKDMWVGYRKDMDTIMISILSSTDKDHPVALNHYQYDTFNKQYIALPIGKKEGNKWGVYHLDGSVEQVFHEASVLPTWLNKTMGNTWKTPNQVDAWTNHGITIEPAHVIGSYDSDVTNISVDPYNNTRPVLPIIYCAIKSKDKPIEISSGTLAHLFTYVAINDIEHYKHTKPQNKHTGYIGVDICSSKPTPILNMEINADLEY